MSYLDRDGVSIYYEQRGAGPSVLLSHGYSASARMWEGQMEALSDSYHVIAWDMRGHDRSDSPDDPSLYSHEATIHDMAAKIPGAEKVILEKAGHAANIDQPAAFNAAVRAFLDRVTE